MTGLDPHPVLKLPTREQALAMGQAAFARVIAERARRMALEKADPFPYGYESPIWHVVDDLLVDGKEVKLLLPEGVDVPPAIIKGAPEILITGSNRSAKSEYAGKKLIKILVTTPEGRTWSFADTESISIARQQPLFWKYLPLQIKNQAATVGKLGPITKIGYKQGTGFAGQTFVLPNRAQHWFKNYKQNIGDMEGDQLDAIWLDELRDPELLKTLRVRVGDRGGLIIVTFTSIDENYTTIMDEYDVNSRTVLEVDAELLPILDKDRRRTGRYEKVPRVKIAGPGSDGNQRANIVYFHITDNPYYGYSGKPKPGEKPLFGKERFYKLWRGATREKILSRVYGILSRSRMQQFARFNTAVHVIPLERIPRTGTRYHIVDPCAGRNWAMIWILVDERSRWFIYREWPSYGHNGPSAYIPGIGDPGPWAVKGKSADGEPGTAQMPFGFGLDRYKEEIGRLEGRKPAEVREQKTEDRKTDLGGQKLKRPWMHNPLVKKKPLDPEKPVGEEIAERWMDSRYGNSPTTTTEGSTTLIEQMSEIGMEFLATSGKAIEEGTALLNQMLDYDDETELGQFSARLGRMNEPMLFVADTCPNVRFAFKEWTGKDGQRGACKDFVDLPRYATLADLDYIGPEAMVWQGGGSY